MSESKSLRSFFVFLTQWGERRSSYGDKINKKGVVKTLDNEEFWKNLTDLKLPIYLIFEDSK